MESNIHLSNWDDPFGEELLAKDAMQIVFVPESAKPVDVKLIRARQKKMIPHLQDLFMSACDELRRQGNAARLASEREVLKVVEYRIPDHPHILQSFVHVSTDFAVIMPAGKHGADPIINNIAPAKRVEQLTGHGDVGSILKIEYLGIEQPPEEVRVVFPGLINFLSFWITKIDGPIRSVKYNHTCAEKVFRDFSFTNFLH